MQKFLEWEFYEKQSQRGKRWNLHQNFWAKKQNKLINVETRDERGAETWRQTARRKAGKVRPHQLAPKIPSEHSNTLDKYILYFGQIHLPIWKNTFDNLYKYIFQFGQIHLTIWTNTSSNLDKYIWQFLQCVQTQQFWKIKLRGKAWRYQLGQNVPSYFLWQEQIGLWWIICKNVLGTTLKYFWTPYIGLFHEYFGNIFEICLQYFCNIFAIFLQ